MSKQKTKKSSKKIMLPKELPVEETQATSPRCFCCEWKMSKTGYIAVILGIVILVLLAINKGYIIATIVNGKPIWRSSLDTTLMTRYGKQTLENMITERLIADEANRTGVKVTQAEIDAKEQEVLKSFGGNVTIDDILKFQGMTKSDFDEQIRLQLLLTRLIGKDITITDTDISSYIDSNRSTLTATDEAGLQLEAREAILTQKVGEKIQPWFTELKNKAKILQFIK